MGKQNTGHPEFGHTAGVDATTGPLGQGIAMAVGMAIAERHLAETYNRDSFNVVDHYTYSICGDGDLMEGISSEAASLAGHLELGRLIVLYDSNDISLDGDLDRSFSENVKRRFEAMNWEVLYVEDGNNIAELTVAIEKARQNDKTDIDRSENDNRFRFSKPRGHIRRSRRSVRTRREQADKRSVCLDV